MMAKSGKQGNGKQARQGKQFRDKGDKLQGRQQNLMGTPYRKPLTKDDSTKKDGGGR